MKNRPKLKPRPVDSTPAPVTNDIERGSIRARLPINKHDLDRELSEQPSTHGDVTDRVAHAQSIRDEMKDRLDTIEAKIYLDMRADLEARGEKATEKTLEALVTVDPRRQTAFANLIAAERELAEWTGMEKVWRDRRYMLQELSMLHVSSYFQPNSSNYNDDFATNARKAERAEQHKEAMAKRHRERNAERQLERRRH